LFSLSNPNTRQLYAEFFIFFIAIPVFIAVTLPATIMFPALFLMTAVGLVLLHHTKTFRWGWLLRGKEHVRLRDVVGFSVFVAVASVLWIYAVRPEAALQLLREQPALLLVIALLYPLISALPQELVFRPLFFGRYKDILPEGRQAIVANAAIFSMAHLMYWSMTVIIMTFVGGLAFAWAYEVRRSFALAVILHSVAGVILFAVGLGIFFYSGNVQRPF